MGSAVSPVIADIFMENLEDITFQTGDVEPRVWRRFVDGVIAVHDEYGETLLEHLNKQHPEYDSQWKKRRMDPYHSWMSILRTDMMGGCKDSVSEAHPYKPLRFVRFAPPSFG